MGLAQDVPFERALSELIAFTRDGSFRYRDITRTAKKYAVNYETLRKRFLRYRKRIAVSNREGTGDRDTTPNNFNVHGGVVYETFFCDDALLEKLPVKNRMWQGIKSEKYVMMVFRNGKVRIYGRSSEFKEFLQEDLSGLWGLEFSRRFVDNLIMQVEEIHMAVSSPDVILGQKYDYGDGLVSIETDKTPNKSIEVKIHISQFDKRLKSFEKQLGNMSKELRTYNENQVSLIKKLADIYNNRITTLDVAYIKAELIKLRTQSGFSEGQ